MQFIKQAAKTALGLMLALALTTGGAMAASLEEEPSVLTREERESAPLVSPQPFDGIAQLSPEDAGAPQTARPRVSSPHHKDFAFETDVLLDGVFQSNAMYFQLENYWDVRYAFAQIEVDISQLVSGVPASLTFTVNDTPVASYLIDYENGRSQTFYVEFPTRLLREGYNRFDITGYARIFDEEGCLDDFTGANWVAVRKDSYVRIGYALEDHQQRISYFPYPFISSVDETGSGSYVAVSDAMSERELEAALALCAELAKKTGHEDRIHLICESDAPRDADGVILIAELAHLPNEYRALVESYAPADGLSDRAAVLFTQEGGAPLLLITSEDGECLMEAVSMLMDEERVSQEKGSLALVAKGGIALMRAALAQNMSASGRYTLGDLAGRGVELIGPFHQEATIYLPYSGGYVLSEASKASLHFRYSDNLDFDRSMITVYWGDVPVASKKLTRENAGGDELSFTMPSDVIGTHADSIRVAFELELPELFCTPRLDEMPWAYLADESVFYLPVGENTQYRFELRPYPFEQGSVYNDVVVVVPERLESGELQTLSQLLTVYGTALEPYGGLQVVRDRDLTQEQRKHHLIVFGTYGDNAAVRELNGQLGFAFNDDGSAYESNSALILSDAYAREIATLQLFSSPYEEGRAVLVCSAASQEGFGILSDFFEEDENVWALTGDTVLISRDLRIKAYTLQEQAQQRSQPVIKRLMEENRESTVFSIVALSVMLLLLLCVTLVAVRAFVSQRGRK